MSLSLIAVFIPILLMGGIVGRLFREFAVTLSVAILVSLVVSLTTTPMMCARLLAPAARAQRRAGSTRWSERGFDGAAARLRAHASRWALRHGAAHDAGPARRPSALNVYLYVIVPKGFFPQQDTGRLIGGIQADQSISFQAMRQKLADFIDDRAAPIRRSRTSSASPAARSATRGIDVRRAEAARRAQGDRPTR